MKEFASPTRYPYPRFRPDLEILSWPGAGGKPDTHFVRDPSSQTMYEVGETGAFICRLLDGKTPPGDLLAPYEKKFGAPLSAEELDVFLNQLAQSGLLDDRPPPPRRRTFAEIFDPEVFLPVGQFHIIRGDRLVGFLARGLRWAFTWPAHVLFVSMMLAALFITVTRFHDYLNALWLNWGTGFFLLMAVTASAAVMSPRSIIHGVLCKRYGRQVTGIGVALIYYLMPAIYCEWGDVLWVQKSKRLWTFFSGIYYQMIIWSVATIAWHVTTAGSLPNTVWFAISLTAIIGLCLVNGNPLVQMDGYLLFSSWIGEPYFRPRALAAFGSWVTRRPPPEPLTRRQWRWLTLYGGMSFVYAVLHVSVILGALWNQLIPDYEGIGALFTLLGAIYLIHKPLKEYLGRVRWIRWLFAPRAGALCWSVRVVLVLAVVGVQFVPIPYHTGGPCALAPIHRADVRTEVEGLVEEVLVREGDWVEPGQPIARLGSRVPERNLSTAEAQLAKARADLELLRAGARAEIVASAEEAVNTARTRLSWSSTRADRYGRMLEGRLVSAQSYENAVRQRDLDKSQLQEEIANLAVVRSGSRPEQIAALEAKVKVQQALVEGFQGDMERTTLLSPIAGRVVTPRIEELKGAYLKPGQNDLVARIEDARTILAEVEVPESDIADVRPGTRVEIVTWAFNDRSFVGSVASVAPVAGPDTAHDAKWPAPEIWPWSAGPRLGAVQVTSEIPNADGLLKADMTGNAKIDTGRARLGWVMARPIVRWFKVRGWSWLP